MFQYFTLEEIQNILSDNVESLALLASYDIHPRICPNFLAMVHNLSSHFDKMVLMTNERPLSNKHELPHNCTLRFVPNEGHDFGMWSRVCHVMPLNCGLKRLALINDSALILKDLAPSFKSAQDHGARFWGMTLSHEVSTHLQSYFLVADDQETVKWMLTFFHTKDISQYVKADKRRIVFDYEVGLSRHMLQQTLLKGLYTPENLKGVTTTLKNDIRRLGNPSWVHWDALLTLGFPLLKKYRGKLSSNVADEHAFITLHTDPHFVSTLPFSIRL